MRNHTKNPNTPEKSGEYQVHRGTISNRSHSVKKGVDQQITNNAETSKQAPKKQKLQSVFNLVKSIKGKQAVICAALTGEQAASLVTALGNEINSPLLIKFAGMEVTR